jgi:hypothetical protein
MIDLFGQARKLISHQPHFRGRDARFEFRLVDEVLVIRGQVPTFFLKQVLQRALMELEGIERIDNQVEVVDWREARRARLPRQ